VTAGPLDAALAEHDSLAAALELAALEVADAGGYFDASEVFACAREIGHAQWPDEAMRRAFDLIPSIVHTDGDRYRIVR